MLIGRGNREMGGASWAGGGPTARGVPQQSVIRQPYMPSDRREGVPSGGLSRGPGQGGLV